ncbi:D-aminoacylase (plasmid) [Sphingomonas paeninsulae]|uniref:D-aminoacylase n=1 Tax=Sphingomonas paeninsulae TaxID=2319844 RepID=A0A494TGB7_SPHPE|nr:amidohydrolase family protein [Sphingomonas paeninsulae]AYJ84861.1 D-aminoacylase [Sphingomonas paeninsulae]
MIKSTDLLVRNGLVYDGTGGEPYQADIAIRDGLIVEIGKIESVGGEEIDAAGCIVTPGFVDIHTHYDGQLIWATKMLPSSCHGVTTVVTGNCGVGFAPVHRGDEALLISAMEGVEDIPEIVMSEGLTWEWETFPEFLNAVEKRPHDIDFGVYLPHSALRIYAMGSRGAAREPATDADLSEMKRLVAEAIAAGAMGVASSLVDAHRRADGEHLPSWEAHEHELVSLATAIGGRQNGVFQLVPELNQPEEEETRLHVSMLERISQVSGVPVTFTLAQSNRYPDRWRKILGWVDAANRRPGVELRPQTFPRPVGMLLGHNLSNNPFLLCPSYGPLASLSLDEKMVELRKPDVRARLISETPMDPTLPLNRYGRLFERMFYLGDPPNYEPAPEESMVERAARIGVTPAELAYDLLMENDGNAILYCAFANFGEGNLDFVVELTGHPDAVIALGDGGAHYGLICDASYTTFMLTHWVRDRKRERMPLSHVIKALTVDPANLVGLTDRGRIAVGLKGDLNVIDHQKLRLYSPEVCYDLPAGGRRLHQRAEGYRWTIVSGEPIFKNGQATGKLPGRLVRRGHSAREVASHSPTSAEAY